MENDVVKIDIKACNTKGRDIVDFSFEFLELADDYFVYAGKMVTEEWNEDEEESDIDNLIKAANSKKKVDRSWHLKYKKEFAIGVEKFISQVNDSWEVAIFTVDGDDHMIAFATQQEADEVYKIVDNWLFKNVN